MNKDIIWRWYLEYDFGIWHGIWNVSYYIASWLIFYCYVFMGNMIQDYYQLNVNLTSSTIYNIFYWFFYILIFYISIF